MSRRRRATTRKMKERTKVMETSEQDPHKLVNRNTLRRRRRSQRSIKKRRWMRRKRKERRMSRRRTRSRKRRQIKRNLIFERGHGTGPRVPGPAVRARNPGPLGGGAV